MNKYSDEIKTITYLIGWYGMRTYTIFKLKINNLYNNYFNVSSNNVSKDPYISKIILLNNGNEIMNSTTKINNNMVEPIKYIKNSNNNNSYDFIICEYVVPKNDCTYVRLTNNLEIFYNDIDNTNDIDNMNDTQYINYDNLEKSDIHFLSSTIVIKDKKYIFNINNKSEKVNSKTFYLLDNILFHESFIKWYLNKYHNVNLDELNDNENIEYLVQFFNNNMDYITLSNKEHIILGKTDYQLIYNKNEDDVEDDSSEVNSEVNSD